MTDVQDGESPQAEASHVSPFEQMRQMGDDGSEYWSARDLAVILGYDTNYRNFKRAIEKAEIACVNSGYAIEDHFADTRKMIALGKGAKRSVEDVHLSRYACYLVNTNHNPRGRDLDRALKAAWKAAQKKD